MTPRRMPAAAADDASMSLWRLSWPIMIEFVLQFALGTADTLMVSRLSDNAVAVTGLSNQYLNSILVVFTLVSSGAGVLIAQKLGAKDTRAAGQAAMMAIQIAALAGIALGAASCLGAPLIDRLIQVPGPLMAMAVPYMRIVGLGLVFSALNTTAGALIRNTGNTKSSMYISLGMNVVHVLGNYAFIFGALGFPKWGLTGVAVSTAGSRALALVVQLYALRGSLRIPLRLAAIRRSWNAGLLRELTRIGWPMAVGQASWAASQLIMFAIIATLGPSPLAARTYMSTIEQFAILFGWSLSVGLQVRIAYLYGAGRRDDAYRSAYRAFYAGLSLVMATTLLLLVFIHPIISWFTDNRDIYAIVRLLLWLNLIYQPVKMANMAFNTALVAVGDTRYIMTTNLILIWTVCVGLSFLFGLAIGWGIVGVYAAMILDEGIRGWLVYRRWRRRRAMQAEGANSRRALVQASGRSVFLEKGHSE